MRARLALSVLSCCGFAAAGEPVRSAWIRSTAPVSRIAPDVHSVDIGGESVEVKSAGVSLKYLGPLQARPLPDEKVHSFVFRIPLHPQAETGRRVRVPVDVTGVFVNGMPIYNQFEALSYNEANLWHYDPLARKDTGHPAVPGLLESLVVDAGVHSPLIGFALDGYPVYGPWAYANPDGTGGLRRMRSSYRLRSIARRQDWADGTQLTPAQYGPDVDADHPLGSFSEDYQYVAGSGDLDESNGRFAKTPEYPDGTYAYFLSTNAEGQLAYPYLIGPRFRGRVADSAGNRSLWSRLSSGGLRRSGGGLRRSGGGRLELSVSEARIAAGRTVRFRLAARTAVGDSIRHFEYVHERPIHLLIASADLAEFDHIHPELAPDDSYQVDYAFAHGGRYRMWADFSLPGESPRVDEFDVTVAGQERSDTAIESAAWHGVKLERPAQMRAGEDIPFTLRLSGSLDKLEPYLGAWAHAIVIGEGWRSFTHVHPTETVHAHADAGPAPSAIRIVTSFPAAGMYKLWAQFQEAGKVVTVPFILQVGQALEPSRKVIQQIPANAVRVAVTQHGYEPAKLTIPANTPLDVAFTRDSAPNCGSEVVFPSLGIRKALPLGETVVVRLPAQSAGEFGFACGMGMYRGAVVVR
jgi:hypothetical protein